MQHFKTRNDLLRWLENNAPRKAIEFAMVDGKIELLGVFNNILAGTPGWIVKVTSKRGLSWNVIIAINRLKHDYFVYTIKNVQWENYMGGNTPLFAGDNPKEYERLKNEKK